jgi:hypothetical protein
MGQEAAESNRASRQRPLPVLDYAPVAVRKGSPIVWTIAFLCFPFGPFIYLAYLGAIGLPRAIVLMVAAAFILNVEMPIPWWGIGDENRAWLRQILAGTCYCCGMLQYMAGERHGIWSAWGRRLWIIAAWAVGTPLIVYVFWSVIEFRWGL